MKVRRGESGERDESREVWLAATLVELGQAMADIATIGILQARTVSQATVVAEQLQEGLKGRINLEPRAGWPSARGLPGPWYGRGNSQCL